LILAELFKYICLIIYDKKLRGKMAENKKQYEKIDMPFYKTEIEPKLPKNILVYCVINSLTNN